MRKQIIFMVLAILFLICAPVATYFIVESVQPSAAQPPAITNPQPENNQTPANPSTTPDDDKTPDEGTTNPPTDPSKGEEEDPKEGDKETDPSEGETNPDVNNPSEGDTDPDVDNPNEGDHNPDENPDTGDTNPDDADPEEGNKDPDEGEGEGGNEPSEDDPEPTPPNPKNEEASSLLAELYGIDNFSFDGIDVSEIVLSETQDAIESITFTCADPFAAKQNIGVALISNGFSQQMGEDGNVTTFAQAFEDHILTITLTQNEGGYILTITTSPIELSETEKLAQALSELFEAEIGFDGFEISDINIQNGQIDFSIVGKTQDEVVAFFNSFLHEDEQLFSDSIIFGSAMRGDKFISIMIMFGESAGCSISY